MKTYNITSNQISQIHNASCYLKYAYDQASELFKDDSQLIKNLKTAINNLEPVRKELVEKKDIDHDKIYNQAKSLSDNYNLKYTIWSIYDIDSLLDETNIPFGAIITAPWETENTVTLEKHDEEDSKKTFATWIDLWKAVDKLAANTSNEYGSTGFGTHVFIEGIHKVKKSENVYAVSLGS